MGRSRRKRDGRRDWNGQGGRGKAKAVEPKKPEFHRTVFESAADIKKKEDAIRELRGREVACPVCGEKIIDIASAIADRQTGGPAHFECVIGKIQSAETLGENESVAYIGQGRFAVLRRANPSEPRSFKIVKTIEWEKRDAVVPWRAEISGVFSQVL